ncbi:MAG: hypothetical protein ABI321_06930 [Polyangia bacterium]
MSASRVELAQMRVLLAEAKARRQLPVLDNLHIAAPCKADWDRMAGDARARFCGSCEKNVYNLSDMTRAEAEALLVEKEGKLCVRYFQRADGTILTADCPTGVATRRRKRRVVAATFSAVSAVAAAAGVFGARSQRFVTIGAPMPPPHVAPVEPTPQADVSPVKPTQPEMLMGEPMQMMGGPVQLMGKISPRTHTTRATSAKK